MSFVERDARDWAVRQLKGVPPSPARDEKLEELYKERLAYRTKQEEGWRLARIARGKIRKTKPAAASPGYRNRLSAPPVPAAADPRHATHMGTRHSYWD